MSAYPRVSHLSDTRQVTGAVGNLQRLASTAPPTLQGAMANGLSDDSASFVSAIASGGTIYVPDGTYLIDTDTAALAIDNEVHFYGSRKAILLIGGAYGFGLDISAPCSFRGLTIKRRDACLTAILVYFENTTDGVRYIDCLIDGNMLGQTSAVPYFVEFSCRGVFAAYPKNIHWQGCEFTDTGNRALDMRAAGYCSVTDSYFHDCGTNVFSGNLGTCIEFTANETGGFIGQSHNVVISGNRFQRWGDGAINSRMVDNHTISGNVMEGHGYFGEAPLGIDENGIAVLGGSSVAVTGNTVRLVKSSGIILQTRNDNGVVFNVDEISATGNVLVGGPDSFNVGGTATLETSCQIKNQNTTTTMTNVGITGNTFRMQAAGMNPLSMTCNGTTGILGLTLSGNSFYGTGTADSSKAIVLPSTGIGNLLGLNISGNSFYNFQYGMYQATGTLPTDAVIRGNQYGNVASRSNLSVPSVTQATSKTTGVQLDTMSGQIVMNAASLAAATTAAFILTNNKIAAGDTVSVSIGSGASGGSYNVDATSATSGASRIELRNYSAGALAEAVVINFSVSKGVAA